MRLMSVCATAINAANEAVMAPIQVTAFRAGEIGLSAEWVPERCPPSPEEGKPVDAAFAAESVMRSAARCNCPNSGGLFPLFRSERIVSHILMAGLSGREMSLKVSLMLRAAC